MACMANMYALNEHEQVSMGQELLSILREQPLLSDSCTETGDVDVKVLVKHGFIEVVDPRGARAGMNRSMSDSALLTMPRESGAEWQKVSSEKWQEKIATPDFSDASTTISGEAEDSYPAWAGLSYRERKDTCWSDDELDMNSMQQCMPYQYVDASWWMMPMAFDPNTAMYAMGDESSAWTDQTQWADQTVIATEDSDADAQEWRTTVMLRNMPNNYTRDMLLELVDSMGFAGCYDFAYLPVDFKSQAGLGYAFINFVSTAEAQRCFDCCEGFSEWKVPSEKVCTVTWGSPYQGLEAHIERYQNSPVMHHSIPDEWKPVLLGQGVRIAFPPPTKPIKTPKVRQQPVQ